MPMLPYKGYYTAGVSAEIQWPSEEVVVEFRGRKLHLLPETDKVSRMVRLETTAAFSLDDAEKLVLEFLSSLAWADQHGIVTTLANWSTAPLAIGKGPTGIIGSKHFDYLPDPPDPRAKRALALYREGLSVNHVPFQVLGFFKVINVIRDKGPDQKQWIRDNLQYVTAWNATPRLAALQSTEPDVANYLYSSCRCAVAHAFDPSNVVNPDEPADLDRLRDDLPIIRDLARIAIERDLGIKSESDFHREHLYELEGFRALFGETLVGRIKAGGQVPAGDVPVPKLLALRVRDQDRLELFESMAATVDSVLDGCVRLRLVSACGRLVVVVTLNFAQESLISDPLRDIHSDDDGTPEAAKTLLQLAQIHRWWFGGNGVIEIWDKATDVRLARAQPYMPPVNSRFPHEDFEKMERELRLRAGIADPSVDAAG